MHKMKHGTRSIITFLICLVYHNFAGIRIELDLKTTNECHFGFYHFRNSRLPDSKKHYDYRIAGLLFSIMAVCLRSATPTVEGEHPHGRCWCPKWSDAAAAWPAAAGLEAARPLELPWHPGLPGPGPAARPGPDALARPGPSALPAAPVFHRRSRGAASHTGAARFRIRNTPAHRHHKGLTIFQHSPEKKSDRKEKARYHQHLRPPSRQLFVSS